MNQDEDYRKPDLDAAIDPELEARLVAWVAGEASAFEIAELERLIGEKPELAIFKRRIEAVQGFVTEALRADAKPLRLSEERRAKVLAAIGATDAGTQPAPVTVAREKPARPRPRRRIWVHPIWGLGLAATIAVGVFVLPVSVDKKPSRPDPVMVALSVAPGDNTGLSASSLDQMPVTGRAVPLEAPMPRSTADAVVKLDAFVVSEARDVGYAAMAISAARPEPKEAAAVQLLDKSALTLGDAPTVALAQNAAIGGAGGLNFKRQFSRELAAASVATEAAATVAGTDTFRANFFDADGARNPIASNVVEFKGGQVAGPPPSLPWSQPMGWGNRATELSQTKPNTVSTSSGSITLGMSTVGSMVTLGASPVGGAVDAKSTVGGAFGAEALPASPPANEPMQLSAFVVSGEKQGSAAAIPNEARRSGAGQVVDAVPVAKDSTADGRVLAPLNETLAVNDDHQVSEAEKSAALAKLEAANARLKKLREERARMIEERKSRDNPPPATSPAQPANQETGAAQESVSTFSLHVSDVSFRLAVAAMAARERGENPPLPEIRAEEFYNAFNYGDPAPAMAEKIAARIEQSAHPYLQQRNLLRIAMKVPATGRSAGQPLRLTVLLDTSGSMEREDRRMSVRRALEELIGLLGANDRLTLIGFARQPRLLAESVAGNQAGHLVELSGRTPAEGGTNLEEALKLAGELAIRHRQNGAQNRIVMLTDGAANLGGADPAQLATRIDALRQQGIAFDACGIGLEGIGDAMLEALTRRGDGRYYVIDRPEAADAAFARQLAGAFRPAAENVKLQVRFNPARVGRYRLIGFDSHRLRTEDFRNDQVDAAELAAGEGATALYQVEVLPQGTGEVGEVFVRFRDAATGTMVERSWSIAYEPAAPRFARAMPSLQLAGLAALVAEKLGTASQPSAFKLGDFAGVANAVRGQYASEPRVQDLVTLYGRLRRMTGE